MKVFYGRVKKVGELALRHVAHGAFHVGQYEEGHFDKMPTVGERFQLVSRMPNCGLWTSTVTKVGTGNLFETENSVYELSHVEEVEQKQLKPGELEAILKGI